jgi:hypothetical protein
MRALRQSPLAQQGFGRMPGANRSLRPAKVTVAHRLWTGHQWANDTHHGWSERGIAGGRGEAARRGPTGHAGNGSPVGADHAPRSQAAGATESTGEASLPVARWPWPLTEAGGPYPPPGFRAGRVTELRSGPTAVGSRRASNGACQGRGRARAPPPGRERPDQPLSRRHDLTGHLQGWPPGVEGATGRWRPGAPSGHRGADHRGRPLPRRARGGAGAPQGRRP